MALYTLDILSCAGEQAIMGQKCQLQAKNSERGSVAKTIKFIDTYISALRITQTAMRAPMRSRQHLLLRTGFGTYSMLNLGKLWALSQ
jgi:hypothetical protein